MAYIHAHGVILRNIKLSNFLIDENSLPGLADFGISKQLVHCLVSSLDMFPAGPESNRPGPAHVEVRGVGGSSGNYGHRAVRSATLSFTPLIWPLILVDGKEEKVCILLSQTTSGRCTRGLLYLALEADW